MKKFLILVVLLSITVAPSATEESHCMENTVRMNSDSPRIPEKVRKDELALYVYRNNEKTNSCKWKSAKTFNNIMRQIRDDGQHCTLYFSPGTYEIESELKLLNNNNVDIIGSPGTKLTFSRTKLPAVRLIRGLKEGDTKVYIDHLDFFEKGHSYEVFKINKNGDFQLEFKVIDVDKGIATIVPPVSYFANVKEIPKGSWVYKRYNIFSINNSNDVKISGFVFDGLGLGEVRGHLSYSGILVRNSHHIARKKGSPVFKNFTVEACDFKSFKGRGIAVYATSNVTIKDCTARDMAVEVFELDHMSSGRIIGNAISDSHIAIQINDAYDSIVKGNIIKNVTYGITLYSLFDDPWVNNNIEVTDNQIQFKHIGIDSIGKYNKNIIIRGNYFSKKQRAIVGDISGCSIEGNHFATAN